MLDNTLNQSVEFLSDGIYYYQFDGPMNNFKYFFAVVFNKKHQFMHKCLYEDIEKLEVVAKKKAEKAAAEAAKQAEEAVAEAPEAAEAPATENAE